MKNSYLHVGGRLIGQMASIFLRPLIRFCAVAFFTFVMATSISNGQDQPQKNTQTTQNAVKAEQANDSEPKDKHPVNEWQELFDGKTLEGWKKTNFGGEGEVIVEDGVIKMATGATLTGITSKRKDLPKIDYEVEFEARRTAGLDFFAALTFQFNDSFCTFLPGGWSGTVVGLSNIDDVDASENDTSSFYDFNDNEWYKFRVAVRSDSIRCWINDKPVIDRKLKDEKITIRPEVLPSTPLGISAWQSESEIRSIKLRKLDVNVEGELESEADLKDASKSTIDGHARD